MRCPQCGTQNEPDSRFCGGCGARVSGVENRLAPTEKIHSDSPMAVQPMGSISPGAGVSSPRRVSAPPEMPRTPTPLPGNRQDLAAIPSSIPPQNNAAWGAATPSFNGSGPSIAPQNSAAPTPSVARQNSSPATNIDPQNATNATGPTPSMPPQHAPAGSNRTPPRSTSSAADASIRPARTRWGLIIFLLLFDAGLATAGTWLLLQGLADPPTVSTSSTQSGAIEPAAPTLRVADVTDASPTPAPPVGTPGTTATTTTTATTPVTDAKPTETQPVVTPADTKPVVTPVDQAPLDVKQPLDTKPVDTTPVEKPADTKPVDTKHVEKPDDKKNRKKPTTDDGRTGPEDPYGDPLPPETK